MRGFTKVSTQEELDIFEDVADAFVDAIIKDARLVNRSWVDDDGGLVVANCFDVHLIVQSQNRDFEIEIVLCRVPSCELDAHYFDDGLLCSIVDEPLRQIRLGGIRGEELFYRTRPKSGRGAVLGPEVPSSIAIPAREVRAGWRQCSECANVWEEGVNTLFSRCPSCSALTELGDSPVD